MPDTITQAEEEKERLGNYPLQILAQEETLKALEQKDFGHEATLLLILAQLDITLSDLRDALRGAGTKDFTTLETDIEAILARLNVNLSTRASETTLATQLNITLSALRDALRGTSNKNFTTLETDTEAILARLQGDTAAHAAVSVGTTATSILAANASRKEWLIYNNGAAILYLGSSNGVTTANGIPIVPHRAASGRIYRGAFWGIVSAGSVDVRRWEVT